MFIFQRWNFLLLATNQIVNVGGTQEVSILEVAEFILENLGIIDQHIVCYDAAAGSANRRRPDVSKLKELVNFQEQVTWQQGIDLTLKELKCK